MNFELNSPSPFFIPLIISIFLFETPPSLFLNTSSLSLGIFILNVPKEIYSFQTSPRFLSRIIHETYPPPSNCIPSKLPHRFLSRLLLEITHRILSQILYETPLLVYTSSNVSLQEYSL